LIRPLLERFKPFAITLSDRFKMREEFEKEFAGVAAIRPRLFLELTTGIPVLHLQFLGEENEMLFESRETAAGMMSNALGITVAVARSIELCQKRQIKLPKSLREHMKESLVSLLGEIKRIATAMNIDDEALLHALSGPVPADEQSIESPAKSHS
jgi:hypothetical protein